MSDNDANQLRSNSAIDMASYFFIALGFAFEVTAKIALWGNPKPTYCRGAASVT
jgi:hypothetical protein